MTYFELRRFIALSLKESNIDENENESLMIIEYVSKLSAGDILLRYNEEVPCEYEKQALKITNLRKKRLPLSYITGKAVFFGYDFIVNKNVLIPRFDTEFLVEKSLEYIKKGNKVADVCCGSGCIGITIAKETGASVYLYDVSREAILITNKNIRNHNIMDKAVAFEKDIFKPDFFESNKFDYIISNPPYIETSEIEKLSPEVKCEPFLALNGGEDGLLFYKRIIDISLDHLNDDGKLLFEIGYNLGDKLLDMCKKKDLKCNIYKDYSKNDRVCIIEK